MTPHCNPLVGAVITPPVAEAREWISGRTFPADKELLDLAQAVPSYEPAEALTRHVATVAVEPATSLYSDIPGTLELRVAFARHLGADYEASVSAENVAITSGCNQAYCVAVSALAGPGDEIILPIPYYFNHDMWLQMQGIEPIYLPFDSEYPERLRLDLVQELITPRTRGARNRKVDKRAYISRRQGAAGRCPGRSQLRAGRSSDASRGHGCG